MSIHSPARESSPAKHKNRAHIYVSIYKDFHDFGSHHEEHHDNGKLQRWTILVEPYKHHHLLNLHHTGIDPLIFFIRREEETRSWACRTRRPGTDDEKNLIGKIMIGESKLPSTVKVEELLRARLPPDEDSEITEHDCEQWIRGAIHALQEADLVERFEIDEFMVFARGYVKERVMMIEGEEDLAPQTVEYKKAERHANVVKKKTGRGFWLSYPHSEANSPATNSREGSPYGGLM